MLWVQLCRMYELDAKQSGETIDQGTIVSNLLGRILY